MTLLKTKYINWLRTHIELIEAHAAQWIDILRYKIARSLTRCAELLMIEHKLPTLLVHIANKIHKTPPKPTVIRNRWSR